MTAVRPEANVAIAKVILKALDAGHTSPEAIRTFVRDHFHPILVEEDDMQRAAEWIAERMDAPGEGEGP